MSEATHSPEPAQEVPSVVRELQAARGAKWAEAIGLALATSWALNEQAHEQLTRAATPAAMALAAVETFEATSGLRQELAQAQAENERLRSEVDDHISLYVDETARAEAAEYALHQARAQVEAAEAREVSLRKAIEALADELDGYLRTRPAAARLRALAAQPAPAADRDLEVRRAFLTAVYNTGRDLVSLDDLQRISDEMSTPAAEPHAEDGATNVGDVEFEEQRRIAAEEAGLVRVGTTDDGRGIYAEQTKAFKSPTWAEIVMHVNRPAPVADPSGNEGVQG